MRSLPWLLPVPVLVLVGAGTALPQKAELPLDKRVYQSADGKSLPYRLLKPDNYDPAQRYPLVLFFHGAGERGTDNDKQLVHAIPEFASAQKRAKYPCFLVAPQCPNEARWVEVDWKLDRHTIPSEPSEPMRLVLALLPALQKEFSIDPNRLYVTGLSMGGFGAWDILCRHPKMFAAAAPVCGGADEEQASRIASVPIWTFHGAKDTVVKPERSRNMIAALQKAGGSPKLTEYPKEGHASWVPAYREPELYRWLFAQRRP